MPNPTLYDNFTRVKNWAVEKFADKEQLAYSLSDVAFSGDYNDLENKPDLTQYTTYAYVYSYVADAISGLAPGGDYATESYVMSKIDALIDGAPAALDTLNELAAAINDDASFASTVTTALGNKANSADVFTKNEIEAMGYISSIPSEYITESELSACGYTVALTQAEMDTLFPISNS